MDVSYGRFIWNHAKEKENIAKHDIDFITASKVFADRNRKVIEDAKHSLREQRYFCIGKIDETVITVRFTVRQENIRIIGAGLWRRGRRIYEKEDH